MYMYIHIYLYVFICIYTYIYTCMYAYTYIYMYIYICIHTCTYIYIYIHMSIHTYTYYSTHNDTIGNIVAVKVFMQRIYALSLFSVLSIPLPQTHGHAYTHTHLSLPLGNQNRVSHKILFFFSMYLAGDVCVGGVGRERGSTLFQSVTGHLRGIHQG